MAEKQKNIIIKRINMTLHKILLLTLIHQFTSLSIGAIEALFDDTTHTGNILTCATYLDPFITSFVVYLMIENNPNHKVYLKFIRILYNSHICCCCNCLMRDTIESVKQDEPENTDIESIDENKVKAAAGVNEPTETISPCSIEIEMNCYVDESVETTQVAI